MSRVELRVHPDDMGFATGNRSGVPRVTGWFRLHDDEPVDTVALLCALDAFPPTVFNADLPVGWVPTVELTTHVRARPAPGWLRCRFATRYVTGGFLEEDGEIWDGRDASWPSRASSRSCPSCPATGPEPPAADGSSPSSAPRSVGSGADRLRGAPRRVGCRA